MFAKVGLLVSHYGTPIGRPTFIRCQSYHTNRALHEEKQQQYRPPRPVIRIRPQDPKRIAVRKLNWSVEALSKHLKQVNEADRLKYEEEQRIKHEEFARSKEARKLEKKKAREQEKILTEKRMQIEREQRALEKAERKAKLRATDQIKQELKKEFLDVLMEDINQWEYHPKELVYKRYEFGGQLPPKMQRWMQSNVSPALDKFKTEN